ncbi:MAG: SoxR reducing system RseC family protein [Chitinophagales bacterium]
MEQAGTIVRTRDGLATVLVRRPGGCEHCGACELGSAAEQEIELPNPDRLAVGTQVRLVVAAGEVARASAMVYLIPLAGLFLGFGAGELLSRLLGWRSDLPDFLGGVLFVAMAFRGISLWDRRRRRTRCVPRIEPIEGNPSQV